MLFWLHYSTLLVLDSVYVYTTVKTGKHHRSTWFLLYYILCMIHQIIRACPQEASVDTYCSTKTYTVRGVTVSSNDVMTP